MMILLKLFLPNICIDSKEIIEDYLNEMLSFGSTDPNTKCCKRWILKTVRVTKEGELCIPVIAASLLNELTLLK